MKIIYEGGTRVPTITYWPNTIKPGVSNALINQVDLVASIAKMTNQTLKEDVIDSENYWDSWIGKTTIGRKIMNEDISEKNNLAEKYPEKVKEFEIQLQAIINKKIRLNFEK